MTATDDATERDALSSSELRDEVRPWLAEQLGPGPRGDRLVAHRRRGRVDGARTSPPSRAVAACPVGRRQPSDPPSPPYGALRPPGGLGLLMAAPTILTHGTPEQIERLVPPILDGRVAWCQLFSEPGAGSDLAGLTTRAVRDGDRWIINGQKVWSSQALESDYGMLLARTDLDRPKHHGISWFAFPLDQPGVTIRPLREMTGDAVFNEVFLDDAVVRRRGPHRRCRATGGPSPRRRCTSSGPASAPAAATPASRTRDRRAG